MLQTVKENINFHFITDAVHTWEERENSSQDSVFCFGSLDSFQFISFTIGPKNWSSSHFSRINFSSILGTWSLFKINNSSFSCSLICRSIDSENLRTFISIFYTDTWNIPSFQRVSIHLPSRLLNFFFVKKCFSTWSSVGISDPPPSRWNRSLTRNIKLRR